MTDSTARADVNGGWVAVGAERPGGHVGVATSVVSAPSWVVEATFVAWRRLALASYPAVVDVRQLREVVESTI
jgi:hypothetical protein